LRKKNGRFENGSNDGEDEGEKREDKGLGQKFSISGK